MEWYESGILHVFAPATYGDNWVEQTLGEVFLPLFKEHGDDIEWMWMNRYSDSYNPTVPPQGFPVPDQFLVNHNGIPLWRMTAYRARIRDEARDAVYAQAIELCNQAGCYADVRGWLDRNIVDDLGGGRFIRQAMPLAKRESRAKHNIAFLDATLRLMLDSLEQDAQGRWALDKADHQDDNLSCNPFLVVHHLFCNAVQPPLSITVVSPYAEIGGIPVRF